jgi:hypothetical protein
MMQSWQGPSRQWPEITLRAVPPVGHAAALAMELRLAAGIGEAPLGPMETLCALGGVLVRETSLRGARGGLEATLVTRREGFEVTVDAEPRGGWGNVPAHLRDGLRRHRLRFRVAHELAHTLFYDRSGNRPQRLVPNSEEQELFCDEFARALLIPPAVIPPRLTDPRAVVELSRQYDVSLEVAARAAAASCCHLWFGLYVYSSGQINPQWLSSLEMGPPWINAWMEEWSLASGDSALGRGDGNWFASGIGLASRRQVLVVARRGLA